MGKGLLVIFALGWLRIATSIDTFQLETIQKAKIIDFQSHYQREVNGFIKDSVLLSSLTIEEDIKQAVSGDSNVVYVSDSDFSDVFESLNINGVTRFTGDFKSYAKAGGELEFPKNISFKALLASLNGESSVPVTLIDVRTEPEITANGALPTAINIPIAQIGQVMSSMEPKRFKALYGVEKPKRESENPLNQNVVLTCRSGGRARAAAGILKKLGFDLRVYPGSFLDWKDNDGPLIF